MQLRIQFAALAFVAALFAGCATSSVRPDSADARNGAKAKPTGNTDDYSHSAIEARTEAHAHYAAAVIHELNDDPEQAAEEFHKAALADPSNESLVLEASSRLLRFRPGDKQQSENAAELRDKAIQLLRKAAARPNASGAVFARLGLAYSMAGKRDLAIEANRNAIKRAPDTVSGYQYLAQLYLQSGQSDEGLKVLDEAAKQARADAAFLIDLGETYVAFGRGGSLDTIKSRALDAFKRAAALKPSHPMLLQRLAEGFSFLGEFDLGIEWYQKLLQKLPNLTIVRDKLIELYIRKNDRAKAAEQLRAVLRDAPTNPQAQYLLGSVLLEDNQFKEAAECFNKAILLTPSFEPVYYDLAAAQINMNQPREALATLDRAREKFQQSFIGEFYAAGAYTSLKDYSNALNHFTAAEVIARATATNRLTHTFYFQMGVAYEQNRKLEDAEKYFKKALQLSPNFPAALNYLGYMWADRGQNLQEAHEMIEKAVQLEPKNAAYLDSLGWVLFKLDKPQEALKWILQAIEHSKEPDATLYDHLGDIYAALQKTDKAREAWQKALSLEPSEQIEKKLKPGAPSSSTPPAGSNPR